MTSITISSRFRRFVVLAWTICLPLGWLAGWVIGAQLGYLMAKASSEYNIQQMKQFGEANGSLIGGSIGCLVGWGVASGITTLSLRSILPHLKRQHFILIILANLLPILLIFLAYQLLNPFLSVLYAFDILW